MKTADGADSVPDVKMEPAVGDLIDLDAPELLPQVNQDENILNNMVDPEDFYPSPKDVDDRIT